MTRTEWQRVGIIRQQGAAWADFGQYWLFGTCMYKNGAEIDDWRLIRDAKLFFNALDRCVLERRFTRNGVRLERQVFAEFGKQLVNGHLHFFIKGRQLQHRDQIVVAAERIWLEKIRGARNCVVLDNTQANRAGYGWKEFDKLDVKTLLVECCN